jgi:hypothetical protein
MPSFEAFGRYLEAANPFAFWMKAAQLTWMPWLGLTHALAPPEQTNTALPKPADE